MIAVHDDSTAMDPIIVVSRISSVLKPSTPRKYSAPIDGIHGARSTNWKSGFCGLYQNHSGTEIDEADERDDVRDPADGVLVLLVHEQQQQRAGERREQDRAKGSDS